MGGNVSRPLADIHTHSLEVVLGLVLQLCSFSIGTLRSRDFSRSMWPILVRLGSLVVILGIACSLGSSTFSNLGVVGQPLCNCAFGLFLSTGICHLIGPLRSVVLGSLLRCEIVSLLLVIVVKRSSTGLLFLGRSCRSV